MNNIAGNFNTTNKEIEVVKIYLSRLGVDFFDDEIKKYDVNATAGDIIYTYGQQNYILFEVKEESLRRINRFNQLGIDYISAFHFKVGVDDSQYRGINHPLSHNAFINSIDRTDMKWGKIINSDSKVWIFFCKDNNSDEYKFIEGYDFYKMKKDNFLDYLIENCQFAVNNKSNDQLSRYDDWESATFFVDREYMRRYLINSKEELFSI